MVNLQDLSDEQIARLKKKFEGVSQAGGTEPVQDVAQIPVQVISSAAQH
jgi:hypothetical protein